MPTTVYHCPIPDCAWTHTDNGPEALDGITPADTADLATAHDSVVAAELGAHYETHGAPEWVVLVHRLKQQLGNRQVLACVGCMSDCWQAEQQPQRGTLPPLLPPIQPALTMVGGNALCRSHLSFGEPTDPQLPGRTPGGLIMPGGN